MTIIYEKVAWCADCGRDHVIKLYSTGELNEQEKARFLVGGDYADQFRKHTVCGTCGCNITPHTDIDIVAINGEWKEICLECFQKA